MRLETSNTTDTSLPQDGDADLKNSQTMISEVALGTMLERRISSLLTDAFNGLLISA